MDLNALLYAHQIAVMNAAALQGDAALREAYALEALDYARRISQLPGALEIA